MRRTTSYDLLGTARFRVYGAGAGPAPRSVSQSAVWLSTKSKTVLVRPRATAASSANTAAAWHGHTGQRTVLVTVAQCWGVLVDWQCRHVDWPRVLPCRPITAALPCGCFDCRRARHCVATPAPRFGSSRGISRSAAPDRAVRCCTVPWAKTAVLSMQ